MRQVSSRSKGTESLFANADDVKPLLRWVARSTINAVVFSIICLLAIFIVIGCFAIEVPYLLQPSLLRDASSPGASFNDCVSQGRINDPSMGFSTEFSQRLAREYPPGTLSSAIAAGLQHAGFRIVHQFAECSPDSTIKMAVIEVHGFGTERGRAYWKVDRTDHVVWTRGIIDLSGFP